MIQGTQKSKAAISAFRCVVLLVCVAVVWRIMIARIEEGLKAVEQYVDLEALEAAMSGENRSAG